MSYKGTVAAQQVRNDNSFVHGQGWSTVHEWVGGINEVNGLLSSYINNGWEVVTTESGPYLRLTATRGDAGNPNTDFYDKFSINKENIQKSIWTLPEVILAIVDFNAANSGLAEAYFKKLIQDAVDTGDESELITHFGPAVAPSTYGEVGWSVYRELCRGAESWETEYIVLARERLCSLEYYVTDIMPIPALNAARIYPSTASLFSHFNIPTIRGVTWPDAVTPTNSATDLQWGWRERRREIRFQEGARVEVVQDWTWAEWSTNLYTLVTP